MNAHRPLQIQELAASALRVVDEFKNLQLQIEESAASDL